MIETNGPSMQKAPDWPRVLGFTVLDDHQIEWQLAIEQPLIWLQGHFPDNPVLPGIAQLHWAIGFGQRQWPILQTVCRVENLKFLRPVQPPAKLLLNIKLDATRPLLRFEYRLADEACSNGRVGFT